MAYTPTAWVNGTTPAINATNLNKIEVGIDEAHDDIATLNAALVTDLIAGVTPTLADWTVDPTDSADITDGDPATFCTAGNKVCGAGYQYAWFVWDLGAFYDVYCSVVGNCVTTAGTGYMGIRFWDGSAWVNSYSSISYNTAHAASCGAHCSKVALAIYSSAAATITPNIREFSAWRL